MNRYPFTPFQRNGIARSAGGHVPGNPIPVNPALFGKGKAALLVLVLSGICVLAPAAFAADYSLAGGTVRFSAPDGWPMLMEKLDGPRQFIALQIKDPGNATALARITVTTEQVDDVQGFQQFITAGTARARKLPGYVANTSAGNSSSLRYTASENSLKYAYTEVYAYRAKTAIQVRCIRPVAAVSDWIATFDAGCRSIAATIEK
ncbi:MAG: hypothetical protein EPN38_07200 [Rhodanobacteraceae bacterium]|nr:MAG: hypothetical protein EPN38_07200 [Rhodanobacteraceae bacterium]